MLTKIKVNKESVNCVDLPIFWGEDYFCFKVDVMELFVNCFVNI